MQRHVKLFLALLLTTHAWAALPNGTVWEVRTLGAATNGGGFVTGGTDMSQFNNKNAAACTNCQSATVNISTADVVATGVATVTSVTANFSAAIVGNIIHLVGTGITTGFYEVITFTNVTTVILDRSPGTGTATSGIGGALNSIATLNTALGTTNNIQQTAWVKADATYTVTANQSLGPTCTAGTNGCSIQVNGYTGTRGDGGYFTIQGTSGSGYTLLTIDNNNNLQNLIVRNVTLDCNGLSNSTGFGINANGNSGQNIEAKNCGAWGIALNLSGGNGGLCLNCYSHNNPGAGRSGGFTIGSQGVASQCIWCVSVANGTASGTNLAVGFQLNGGSLCAFCIAANNTGSTDASEKNEGFYVSNLSGSVMIVNSVAYGNSQDGLRIGVVSNYPFFISNSIFVDNGGWGINSASTTYTANAQWENYNGFFGNTSGAITGLTSGANDVTLTADPFTNGAGNVFTLNNTAGAGKAAQGAAFPGTLAGSSGTGYLDIGALQHQVTGTGAKASPILQ